MTKKKMLLNYSFLVIGMILILTNSCKKVVDNNNQIKDIDGNVYNIVTIGTQVWMVENLKVTHYNDGTDLPNITDETEWTGLSTPAYCWYNNDYTNYGTTYGALYNWYVVDPSNTKKIAPKGWHIPTDAEWTNMENYLISSGFNFDGTTIDNKIAKSLTSLSGWSLSESMGSIGNTDYPLYRNKTGFTALPAGDRYNGKYSGVLNYSSWWSVTEKDADFIFYRYMYFRYTYLTRDFEEKANGLSVRCIKD